MTPAITPEMRDALTHAEGGPILVTDTTNKRDYVLYDAQSTESLFHRWLAHEFEVGLASVDAGRVGPLDMEHIKAQGRERLKREQSPS